MTYVVNDNCVKCKLTECVEVCPVDCFYEGENMLVINPDECIDCGVCEPECPINAIEPDTNKNTEKLVVLNKEMSAKWPNINKKKDPLPDADKFKNIPHKLEKYFSDKPGSGNKLSCKLVLTNRMLY